MCIPKEPQPTGTTRQVRVSTYLALTFGTLLSSQRTDASFKTVSPVSPDVCPFGVSNLTRIFPAHFPGRFSDSWVPVPWGP
ncbi:hypothetical protein DQ392_13420 [Streptomyces reniochalinae]|uniref:Uncharacterized protein n=1 Tax=Streptomyces reniochalinae TaxID=2250578 RepID=A0A367EJS8_9ACTN|nr:hypothetical protein DQ392_13420 [Streptomyces reniochalinae]